MVRPGDAGQLHYCAIGIATAAFSLAPEYKLVTGNDPFTRSHIEQIADLVCEFLFIRSGNSATGTLCNRCRLDLILLADSEFLPTGQIKAC